MDGERVGWAEPVRSALRQGADVDSLDTYNDIAQPRMGLTSEIRDLGDGQLQARNHLGGDRGGTGRQSDERFQSDATDGWVGRGGLG